MCALFIPEILQAGAVKGLMHEVMKKTVVVKGHLHCFSIDLGDGISLGTLSAQGKRQILCKSCLKVKIMTVRMWQLLQAEEEEQKLTYVEQ